VELRRRGGARDGARSLGSSTQVCRSRGVRSLGGTSMAAAWRGGDLDKLWRPSQRRRGWLGRRAQLLFF